ncbi:MAG: hypothetical protein IID44_13540 [Planctomycetes bacterium]|nr:hypothetical protein [Planctomycetota bacterium]
MSPHIPLDTTAEAHAVQVAAWRKMTPAERVALACELSDNVRQIAAEGACAADTPSTATTKFVWQRSA